MSFKKTSVGNIPAHWEVRLFKDFVFFQEGPGLRRWQFKDSGMKVLNVTNIKGDGIIDMSITDRYISLEEFSKTYKHFSINSGDVVIASSGNTIGKIGRIYEDQLPAIVNTSTIRFNNSLHPDLLDQEFLYVYLRSQVFFDQLLSYSSGSAQPNVGPTHVAKMFLPVPPLGEQKLIGKYISDIESKIALNRQINQTLEQMAQALFNSWFVDFDPVHAKSQGRQPEGMDHTTAALFPAEFTDSELGPIPKGWEIRSLDEIANYLNGLALQKFPPESHTNWLPVIKIAQLKKGDVSGADRASSALKPEYIVNDGDVLFSWSGSLEVDIWCGGKGALNQHLFKVTSDTFPKWFFYYWTKHHLQSFQAIASAKAVTMGHIQRKHLTEAKCVVPTAGLLTELSFQMKPLLEAQIALRLQARTLAETRDQLLPQLLSGKLSIPVSSDSSLFPESGNNNVVTFPIDRSNQRHIEALLLSAVVRRFATAQQPVDRLRYNKFLYLAMRRAEQPVEELFIPQAAGPYSSSLRYDGAEAIAKQQGFIQSHDDKAFVPGPRLHEIDQHIQQNPVVQALAWVEENFRYLKSEKLGALATVDFAARRAAAHGHNITLGHIKAEIAAVPEWREKLSQSTYTDANIQTAISELKNLFPADYVDSPNLSLL